MRILYISFIEHEKLANQGVSLKIFDQIEAMRNLGHEVTFDNLKSKTEYEISNSCRTNIFTVRPFYPYFVQDLYLSVMSFIKEWQPDLLYVRTYGGSILYNKIFKSSRHYVKKVCIEIPTFPIEPEQQALRKSLFQQKRYLEFIKKGILDFVSSLCTKEMFHWVDMATVIGNSTDKAYRIPAVEIDNCVSASRLRKRNYIPEPNSINLLGVANVSSYQGYDRVIRGIAAYDLSRSYRMRVHFWIVGTGDAIKDLERLALDLGVIERIHFVGSKSGQELDHFYDFADIGVSTLGIHRKSLSYASPLKSREYCARGLPFIYSYIDKSISREIPFAVQLPADDSPVNIQVVVDLIQKWRSISNHSEAIREYAFNHLEWENQFQKLFNKLGLTNQ